MGPRGATGSNTVDECKNFLRHWILPYRRERLAMQRSRPPLAQRSQVLGRAVPFVRSESVSRKHHVPLAHDAIAFHLRENGSRRDRGRERVSMDNWNLWLLAVD